MAISLSKLTNNLAWPHTSLGPLRVSMGVGEEVDIPLRAVHQGPLEMCQDNFKTYIYELYLFLSLMNSCLFLCMFLNVH